MLSIGALQAGSVFITRAYAADSVQRVVFTRTYGKIETITLLTSVSCLLSPDMELEKFGPYRIGRVLGRGGMGTVYEGICDTDGSIVAVKVLTDSLDDDTENRLRFEVEIETLKRLRHANIVRLSGFGEEQGQLYYVMELVNGSSLQPELRKKRLFEWYEAAKIGHEILQALRHAHDRGVIHRDIKPANILLDHQGNIKLSDFGIARFFGSQQITEAHSIIGTLEYMSPEQAQGNTITSRTDLYSLGCVLYALLTGKPPFSARSLPELLQKHQNLTPAPIRSFRSDVPEDLGYIIADLLQIRPEDRPRNALLVTKRLRSLLHALAGNPADIKVLPMSPETPLRHQKPIPPSTNGHQQQGSDSEENIDSSDVVDLGKVDDAKTDAVPNVQQNESLFGSFRRMGEAYSIGESRTVPLPQANFPGNSDASRAGEPAEVYSLAETVTAFSPPPLPAKTDISRKKDDLPGDSRETSGKQPKTSTRFTAVTSRDFDPFEDDRHSRPLFSLTTVWASVTLMTIGLTAYYLLLPVPPEILYKRITSKIQRGELVHKDIERFLSEYPEHPAVEEIRAQQYELELSEHERRLERRTQFSTQRSLSPVERAYVEVLSSTPNHPEQTIDRLRAFIAVFQTSPSSSDGRVRSRQLTSSPVEVCVELAHRRLKKMEQEVDEINAEQEQVLRRRLDEAAELDSKDPASAEGIRRGIIELYQNHRWAKELVEEAKQLLPTPNGIP